MSASGTRKANLLSMPARQQERDLFLRCLQSASQGTPTLLLFEGEVGSGKTYLLEQIADSPMLPRRRIKVALLRLTENAADPVKLAADTATGIQVYAKFGGRRRVLDAVRRVLPQWIGTIPVLGDVLEAIAETVRAVRKQRNAGKGKLPSTHSEDIESIQRIARRKPFALLIDDLQYADEAAVERLRRLITTAETGTRLLVIGSCRPAPPGTSRTPIARMRERLPAPRLAFHVMRPFRADETELWLLEQFPGLQMPADFIPHLLDQTGGQPGILEAAVAVMKERGAIRREAGDWVIDPVAEDATPLESHVIDAEVHALPAELMETLSAASLLGEEPDSLSLARMLERDELYIEDQLATAVRFGILAVIGEAREVGPDFTTVYRFVSATLRASLRRAMSPDARAALEARRATANP